MSAADHYRFIAYGDTRSNPMTHAAIIAEIVGLKPEFVLQTGDLVSDGRNKKQWDEFNGIVKPLHDAHIAYYPARGNHDLGTYYVEQVTEPFDSGNKYYYAFTRHHARFIVLDSMDPDQFSPSTPQYQWLERELQSAQKTATHFFVMFHEGPFSVGPHGPTQDARTYLHPLFVKYHPTAVFCGHDHLYYRTRRDGVYYFVTGGGGAPLYDPDNKALAIRGDVYDKENHVIEVDVDGAKVTATAIGLKGNVIDKVSFGGK